jgi:pimeloyl-ACP methyl ester carboxylesterase
VAREPGTTPNTAQFEPAADSGTVSVNGTYLFYEEAGSGSVVVLLHAGMLDRRMWNPQFAPLAREHRVIRYDIRGYGKSGPADTPYRSIDDLFGLLQALDVRQASLVGVSQGGRIAIDFALERPDMVDRLVLTAPGLSGWKSSNSDTAYFPAARRARDQGDVAALGLSYLGSAYLLPAMEQPDLVDPLRQMTAENGKHWMEILKLGDLEATADPPAIRRASEIRSPVLLVLGTRDLPDIYGIADTLEAGVPDLRRVTIEGAGHLVNLEQPEQFTGLVLDFLER